MVRPNMFFATLAQDYFAGNAQEFDGSFDYDVVNSYSEVDFTQPISVGMVLRVNTIPTGWAGSTGYLWNQGDGGGGANQFGMQALRLTSPNGVRVIIANTASARILAIFPNVFTAIGKYNMVMTWDGSGDISGLTLNVNGTNIARSTQANTLSGSIISTRNEFQVGSRYLGSTKAQDIDVRNLEVINRVATAGEIAAFVDADNGGSFRAGGIGFGSGEYLLAIDFNKTNGNAPTTQADTPSYTITANGGATYVSY